MRAVSAATVIAVEWTLLGLCLALILARLYLRLHLQQKKLILSDYLICLAWVSGTWEAAVDIELKKLGWLDSSSTWSNFLHNTNNIPLTEKIAYVSWFPFLTTQYLNKAALLSFFFNIFPCILRPFFLSLCIVTIFTALSYLASILCVALICVTRETNGFHLASCGTPSSLIIWVTTWALHLTSDLLIFILPFFFLRTLQLDWKKKLGLYITFGFAILSIGACFARFLIVVLTYPNVPITNIELLCAIDSYTGLIVACIPSLRPYINLKKANSYQMPLRDDSCAQSTTERSMESS